MAGKPTSRNWNDIQLVIATGSMVLTLALWNLFAGPDRKTAMNHQQEEAVLPPQPGQTAAPVAEVKPTLQAPTMPTGPILLGGSAPQTTIIVKQGGGGGGDGGGGGVTSTGSS